MRRPDFRLAGAGAVFYLAVAAALVAGIHPGNAGESISGFRAMTDGVLAGRDTISHDYPAAWAGWREFRRSGHIPLWNPHWFGGEPFVGSLAFAPYYPPNWLMAVAPMPLAFNLQYPLHLWLAAMVMFRTCRRRGFGWAAAGIAGLAWGFGGHLATLAGPGHIQKLQTLAWLPLVVFGLGRTGGRDPRRGALPLAAGLALQILAGHLQIVYISLLTGALECAARFFLTEGGRSRPPLSAQGKPIAQNGGQECAPSPRLASRLSRSAPSLILGIALALLLSAPMWLPVADFARKSNRAGELKWEDLTRGSLPPEEAFEFIIPRPLGDSMPHGRGPYTGRYGASSTSSPERVVSDYAGGGIIFLALLGLILPGFRRNALAWTGLAAGGLILSIGGFIPPFYRLALAVVPGFSHFRSPSTFMALLAFGTAMAAAWGTAALFRRTKIADAFRAGGVKAIAIITGAALFAAFAAADLVSNASPFWNAVESAPYEAYMRSHWALDDWASQASAGRGPVRYLEIGGELKNWAMTYSDYAAGREIGSLHGYHPVAYADYFRLLDGLGFTHPNLLKLFAVGDLIVPAALSLDGAPPGWNSTRQGPGAKLLRNPSVRFIRPAGAVREVADWDAMIRWLRDPANDAAAETLIVAGDGGAVNALARIEYRAQPDGPDRWRVQYSTDAPGLIVVAIPADPGWKIRGNGEIAGKAFGYFIIIRVNATAGEIELVYSPWSAKAGAAMAAAGLVLAASMAWRARRKAVPDPAA